MINGKHGQRAHCTKVGADRVGPQIPHKFQHNLSAQAQKSVIFEKSSLWVSVVRASIHTYTQWG